MIGKEHRIGSPVRIEVSIDELVLHGFAPADRIRIREAVTTELARLFTEHGFTSSAGTNGKPVLWATAGKPVLWATARSGETPARLGQSFELAHLDAGSFQMAQGASPERIGAQVAGALWKSVTNDQKE
jgi:hypothetical protein